MNKRTIRPGDTLKFALEVVGKAGEMGLTERKPRLLQSFELEFLMADLSFLGIAPKRMHEMLKFFYKSWADRADMADDWLITGEECQLHRYLKETLEFQGSMIEWEAPGVACQLLEENPQLAEALGIDQICLVDAHLMSRAAQEMCVLAAGGNATATAVDEPSVPVAHDYPCAPIDALDGKIEITHAHANSPEQRFFETPQQEFAFVGSKASEALADGVEPESILIAVPNGAWATGITHALHAQGISAAFRTGDAPLHGDIASFESSCAAQAATLLFLAANPSDGAAWRCWCGFGVHLAHNAFFDELWRYGNERGLGLVESLESVRKNGTQGLNCSNRDYFDVINRYEIARNELARLATLQGDALVNAICEHMCPNEEVRARTKDALLSLMPDHDVHTMHAIDMSASIRTIIAQRPWSNNGVRIGCLEDAADMHASLIIASGMVNGFTPCSSALDATKTMPDKRDRIIKRETKLLEFACSRCNGPVYATGFELIEAALAEKFKLSVDRISIMEGVRVAKVQSSVVLEKA